jgi:hypothetical protein
MENGISTLTMLKEVFPWVLAIIGPLITYLITRPKQQAEIHNTEAETEQLHFQTFTLEAEKFLTLLAKIEEAHSQSLQDDKTIAKLEKRIEDCMKGHTDWIECRDEMLNFLEKAEVVFENSTNGSLYRQIIKLRFRLTAIAFEVKEKKGGDVQ